MVRSFQFVNPNDPRMSRWMSCLAKADRLEGVTPQNRAPDIRRESIWKLDALPDVVDRDLPIRLSDFDGHGSGVGNPVFAPARDSGDS